MKYRYVIRGWVVELRELDGRVMRVDRLGNVVPGLGYVFELRSAAFSLMDQFTGWERRIVRVRRTVRRATSAAMWAMPVCQCYPHGDGRVCFCGKPKRHRYTR